MTGCFGFAQGQDDGLNQTTARTMHMGAGMFGCLPTLGAMKLRRRWGTPFPGWVERATTEATAGPALREG
jgi:hypothetical protein